MDEKVTRKVEYRYDALNRLVGVRYGEGALIKYSYDPAGNLVAVETEKTSSSHKEAQSEQWYMNREGNNRGPYSRDQLMKYIEAGEILSHDMLWSQHLGGWTRAGEVLDLFTKNSNLLQDENIIIPASIVCPRCENRVNSGARFCGKCGSPLPD